MKKQRAIGIDVPVPTEDCKDRLCPFHGSLTVKGRSFVGTVISSKMHKTVVVSWERKHFLPKYERFEKRKTKLHVHNPLCINAKEGDIVRIMQTRPLSKTKNFVVVEKINKENIGIKLQKTREMPAEKTEAEKKTEQERAAKKEAKKQKVKENASS